MIQFYSTLDLSASPDKQNMVDEVVRSLQATFGNCSCECHPNYQWALGCEYTDGSLDITEVVTHTVKPCDFIKDIRVNSIKPFLNKYMVFSTSLAQE